MKKIVLPVVMLVAMALAACGDDNGDGGGDLVEQPEPAAPIAERTDLLNESLTNDDCEQFATLMYTLFRPPAEDRAPVEPGAPGRPQDCEAFGPLFGAMKGTEFNQSQEYGTAALAEGRLAKEVAGYDTGITLWTLDWDDEYRLLTFIEGDPLIGSEPVEGADPRAVAERLVDAAKAGDCADAAQIFHSTGGGLDPQGDPAGACARLIEEGTVFTPAVEATDDPEIEELGITLDQAFYGVATEEAYFTVILGTPQAKQQGALSPEEQADFKVTDVISNTEVELEPAVPEGETETTE